MRTFLEKILPCWIVGYYTISDVECAVALARGKRLFFRPNDKNGIWYAHVLAPAGSVSKIAAERPYAAGQTASGETVALWRVLPKYRRMNERNAAHVQRINQILAAKCGGLQGTFNPDRELPLPQRSLFVPIVAAPVPVAEAVPDDETETGDVPAENASIDALLALPPDACRWPTQGAWCGRPRGEHRSYCPAHAAKARPPRRSPAERAAIRARMLRNFAKDKSVC